jgi:hypothetical protein
MHAGEAAEILMRAIAASDGTRGSVNEHVRNAKTKDGILGSFGFDRNGDTTQTRIFIHRIAGGQLKFDAMITPPPNLLGG